MKTATDFLNHRIRQLLAEKGLSQVKLAEGLETSTGYLSELLNQKEDKRWNFDLLDGLCKTLRVKPWELFVDPKSIYPEEEKRIVMAYKALQGARKTAVDEFMGFTIPTPPNGHDLKKTTDAA